MESGTDSQARTWSMLCHLSALVAIVIPFGHILGPLVVWLVKKNEYPQIDEHAKESLNFQISMTIYGAVALILVFVVVGIPLLVALGLADVVLVVIASIRANEGQLFHYPVTIRFLKPELQ